MNENGVRRTETIFDDTNRKVTVKGDVAAFGDGKLQSAVEYDYLSRQVLTATAEPGNPAGIVVTTTYDPIANRFVKSSPYRSTADDTLEWTCTQMDAFKRPSEVGVFKGSTPPANCGASPDRTGATSIVYDGAWTTTTDPAGAVRSERRNALGQLVEVVEDPAGKNYSTLYSYDPLGNLTQVSQGVQTRTFEYTSLSRLKSAANPESGTTAYTYWDSGDLKTRTDARGVTTNFAYDAMHRILTKTYTNDPSGTPSVTYEYHLQGAPRIGQLKSVSSTAAATFYDTYDELGRVTASTHSVFGHSTPQTFNHGYWLNDAVKMLQYPTGRVINYDVDDAGRTTRVYSGSLAYADTTVVQSPYVPFTADGRIATIKFGNELWETRDYRTPGTATKYKVGTGVGASDRLELEYHFSASANNGNLLSQVIKQPGKTWTQKYNYDALNRLLCAAEGASVSNPCSDGDWHHEYDYDRYGNGWLKSVHGLTGTDVHIPTNASFFNPQTNRLVLPSFDAAGNQTAYDPFSLAYDGENRNISVTSSQNGSGTFAYDGDGRRVKKTWTSSSGTTTTYFFYNALGQMAVEYSTDSAPNPGRVYVHSDMLGSTRLVTSDKPANYPTDKAVTLECYDYLPFGRMLNSGDPQNGGSQLRNTGCFPPNPDYVISSRLPQKFTGKERDAETRLDYFGARSFSAGQGRFTSSDPENASASLFDPARWNAYSYAVNNPYKYVDLDGEVPVLVTGAIGGGIGATLGAGFNVINQLVNNGGHITDVDIRQVGAAAIGGGVTGAIAGLTLGFGTAAVGVGKRRSSTVLPMWLVVL